MTERDERLLAMLEGRKHTRRDDSKPNKFNSKQQAPSKDAKNPAVKKASKPVAKAKLGAKPVLSPASKPLSLKKGKTRIVKRFLAKSDRRVRSDKNKK